MKNFNVEWHASVANESEYIPAVSVRTEVHTWEILEDFGNSIMVKSKETFGHLGMTSYRSIHIDENQGMRGAMGGEFKLDDGRTVQTRDAWSSRASVINTYLLKRGESVENLLVDIGHCASQAMGLYHLLWILEQEFDGEVVLSFRKGDVDIYFDVHPYRSDLSWKYKDGSYNSYTRMVCEEGFADRAIAHFKALVAGE